MSRGLGAVQRYVLEASRSGGRAWAYATIGELARARAAGIPAERFGDQVRLQWDLPNGHQERWPRAPASVYESTRRAAHLLAARGLVSVWGEGKPALVEPPDPVG